LPMRMFRPAALHVVGVANEPLAAITGSPRSRRRENCRSGREGTGSRTRRAYGRNLEMRAESEDRWRSSPAMSRYPQAWPHAGGFTARSLGCGVAALAGSCLWVRLAEPEPDLRAALEDSPVVGELLDDPQPPAAVSAGLWTGR
jgi:hypothetical protein